jgi:hypothetical protein
MLAVPAAPALAFECYNANRSDQGNASAGANSGALLSFERILADPEIVGLCPAGVDHVIEGLDDLGYKTDVLINFRALMAGGLEGTEKGETLLHNGQGIDHLTQQFFDDADALIAEGFALCSPPPV